MLSAFEYNKKSKSELKGKDFSNFGFSLLSNVLCSNI